MDQHDVSPGPSLDVGKALANRVYPLVRPNLHSIRPYVPGRPAKDVQLEFGLTDVVKLASNENPVGPSPHAVAAAQRVLAALNRYPDGATQDIRHAIAQHMNIAIDSILVGNGSDEVLKMLSETFLQPGDEVIVPSPTFPQYAFGASVMDAKTVQVPLLADFQYDLPGMLEQVNDKTKLIYLCSPNNPTGTWLTHKQVARFLAQLPKHVLLILDEAYREYIDTEDPLDSVEFIRQGWPVLSLRTFSKVYGLAALRIGYVIGDPGIVAFMDHVREPFNVNAIAQAAAIAALEDQDHVKHVQSANRLGREQLYAGLRRLHIPFVATQGNFILAEVGDGRAVFEAMQRKGVIVRTGFPGIESYIRITIGTSEDNDRCLTALAQALA